MAFLNADLPSSQPSGPRDCFTPAGDTGLGAMRDLWPASDSVLGLHRVPTAVAHPSPASLGAPAIAESPARGPPSQAQVSKIFKASHPRPLARGPWWVERWGERGRRSLEPGTPRPWLLLAVLQACPCPHHWFPCSPVTLRQPLPWDKFIIPAVSPPPLHPQATTDLLSLTTSCV